MSQSQKRGVGSTYFLLRSCVRPCLHPCPELLGSRAPPLGGLHGFHSSSCCSHGPTVLGLPHHCPSLPLTPAILPGAPRTPGPGGGLVPTAPAIVGATIAPAHGPCLDPWKSWCPAGAGEAGPHNSEVQGNEPSLGQSWVQGKPMHKMFAFLIPSGHRGFKWHLSVSHAKNEQLCFFEKLWPVDILLYICIHSFPFLLSCFSEMAPPNRTLARELCLRFWFLELWAKTHS